MIISPYCHFPSLQLTDFHAQGHCTRKHATHRMPCEIKEIQVEDAFLMVRFNIQTEECPKINVFEEKSVHWIDLKIWVKVTQS